MNPINNPLSSIRNCLCFSPIDIRADERLWWIFNIVYGLDDSPEIFYDDKESNIHNWSLEEIKRLEYLSNKYKELEMQDEK